MSNVWHAVNDQSYPDTAIAVSVVLDMSIELAGMNIAIADSTAAITGGNAFNEVMAAENFTKEQVPDDAPEGITVKDIAIANPDGAFAVVTAERITAIRDGKIHDSVDTSDYVPLYVWHKNDKSVVYERRN